MKKYVLMMAVLLALPAVVSAKTKARGNHPMAGCGLGYLLFGKDDNTKPYQIAAATTNNIYGTQSFGITSGTSGCTEDGMVMVPKQAEAYADVNLKDIQKDMAQGSGEYLDTLAALMGVAEQNRPAFFQTVQAEFPSLYASSEVSSNDLVEALRVTLSRNPQFLS